MRALGVALAGLLACGCSLSGLDRFERQACEDDACCADLNASMPTGDACLAWQQDRASGYCEMLVLDADGDGAPAPECAPQGTLPDCDDADGARAPLLSETCDGRDQDCDEKVDEDAVGASLSSLAVLDGDPGAIVMAGARDVDAVLAVALEGTQSLHLVGTTAAGSTIDQTHALRDEVGPVAMRDLGALASLGSGRYALLVRPSTGCARWALAALDVAAETITTGGEALDPGLPKAAGACPDDTSPVGPASMAADDDGYLAIAWVADGAARECGAASSAEVVVAAGRISGDTRRVGTAAITVGPTDDVAPALLALADDTYLLAIANAGTIRVHRITLDRATLTVSAAQVHTEEATGAGDVHLAPGPMEEASPTFALSWREGCAGETPVATRLLRLEGSTATAASDVVQSGEGAARRLPRAVWQPRASEWVVAWRTSDGAPSAQRLDALLAPIGAPFTIDCGGASCAVASMLLVPRSAGALYELQAARFASGSASIERASFGCAL